MPDTADLVIAKLASDADPAGPGTVLTFQLDGGNIGSVAAAAVVVTDTLADGLTLLTPPSSPGWTCRTQLQVLTCSKPEGLAGGEMFRLGYTAAVDPDAAPGSRLTNEATLSSATADSNSGNDSSLVVVEVATPPTPMPAPTSTATSEPAATTTVEAAVPTPAPESVPPATEAPSDPTAGGNQDTPVPDPGQQDNAGDSAPTTASPSDANATAEDQSTAPLPTTETDSPLLTSASVAFLSFLLLLVGAGLLIGSRRQSRLLR